MTASGVEETAGSTASLASRKMSKPLMEKRRRARINNCLSQLKLLVLDAIHKDNCHYSKLEKADILELTVKHIRQIQHDQLSDAIRKNPASLSQYQSGFAECATEVSHYMQAVEGIPESVRLRLLDHLACNMTKVSGQLQIDAATAATVNTTKGFSSPLINGHHTALMSQTLSPHNLALALAVQQQQQKFSPSLASPVQQHSLAITVPNSKSVTPNHFLSLPSNLIISPTGSKPFTSLSPMTVPGNGQQVMSLTPPSVGLQTVPGFQFPSPRTAQRLSIGSTQDSVETLSLKSASPDALNSPVWRPWN